MISDKDLGMVETHPEIEIGHGQGEEISIEVILDKGTETGMTQETGHGREEETEGIEVYDRQYRGRDRSRDYYRDSRDYGDRDYRDSRSNRGDRSRGNNRKGYNGYNNRRSNHCAGCNCNQSCNHNQRSQNRGNSDGRRNSRGNTPCPHDSIQSMQDSINLIMDEPCNLLDLQDTYKDP